jgi:flagellar basal-body rod protein FlgF
MENTILVGLSRQMALMRQLDVVANNIANLNTTGFKADSSLFAEHLNAASTTNQFGNASAPVRYVNERGVWHDFAQGAIERTGAPLDVAIDGNAFLVVQTPAGERYTRNGSMQINATGQLVNSAGHTIMGDNGPIVFQPNDRDISITSEGRITVREGANTKTESFRGKLRLVNFANPQLLQKDGGNNFIAPAGLTPQTSASARVAQGMIEKSNVNGVLEMSRMIELSRTYTHIAQLMQQQSEMQRSSIERLADVPA